MRGVIVAAALAALSSVAAAAPSVSCTSGVSNCANALNGSFPLDGGLNTLNTAFFEFGAKVTYSLGAVLSLRDITISVDTNDNYRIETSLDGLSWAPLASIPATAGNVASGMEMFSSINSGPFATIYESSLDFAPVNAAFVRVQAAGPGCSGFCAVGETAFLTQAAAVPEPASWALMLGGVAALVWRRRASQR